MVVVLNKKGQTSIEYLLLLAVVFIAAYLMMTRPLADFTRQFLSDIRSGISNVIQHAEWSNEQIAVGNPRHPASRERFRPLHL